MTLSRYLHCYNNFKDILIRSNSNMTLICEIIKVQSNKYLKMGKIIEKTNEIYLQACF